MDIPTLHSPNLKSGFTLIEIMVVIAITVLITGTSMRTLSHTRVALDRTAGELRALLREAQTNALSGVLFGGVPRCGYGVHVFPAGGGGAWWQQLLCQWFGWCDDDGPQAYILYAGPNAGSVNACNQNRNYSVLTDTVVRGVSLSNSNIEIVTPASDVFFEPPDPKTFINNASNPTGTTTITIRKIGAQCPSPDCRTVTVKAAGTIQSP